MATAKIGQRNRQFALALAATALAALGAWHAMATVLGRENPALVQKFDRTNPDALTKLVDLQSARTPQDLGLPRPQMVPLVRETLARQPLNPRALRQLAAYESKQGDDAASRDLLAIGERISRRDRLLNIMLAKNAARDNRVGALIGHMDAALSTFRSGDSQVFSLLAQGLRSAPFRGYMKSYMDRPWAEPFMLYAAQNAPARDVLDVALAAPSVQREPRFERFRTELISHLVSEGASVQALNYVARVAPDRDLLDAVGVTKTTVDPRFAPVSWRLTNASGVYLFPEGDGLAVSVDPAARGRALERVMRLRPGLYRLQTNAAVPEQQKHVSETWAVACLRGENEQVIASREGVVRTTESSLAFSVPGGCDALRFTLDLVSQSDQLPADFEIKSVRLQRVSAS